MASNAGKPVGSIAIAVLAGWTGAEVAWSAPTTPVSPGRVGEWSVIETRCPSFSWTFQPEASAVELAVYAVSEDANRGSFELPAAELVIFERLPGATTSWTPSLDGCLEPGDRYAWLVRGVRDSTDEEAKSAGWSAPRLFEISDRPSFEEVDAAIDLLLRHRDAAQAGLHDSADRSPAPRGGSSEPSHDTRERAAPPARAAQPAAVVPRLRVEGVISGDGSELTFGGAIDSDDLGTNSVGSDEIAAGAVGFSEIAGTEVAIFHVSAGCSGSGLLTPAIVCMTTLCNPSPLTFLTCAGACAAPMQQICANTFVGFLLSPP